MANSKRLRVTEFDFDDVKSNLKTFLKSQTEFKDYDFEGSGINILLDTLAYNTHYLGFNANMLANEMFLDSASLRSSVVSHAKTLGYEVSSCNSPIATLSVTLTTPNSSATMPAGTTFTTTVDDTTYQFVTISDITQTTSGGIIVFEDVIVNFEPRARLVSVRSLPDLDRNAYEVSVEFYVVNAPTELVDMSIMLERLR